MIKQKTIVFINPGQFGYKAGYYYYCKYLSSYKEFNIKFICYDWELPRLTIPRVEVEYVKFGSNKFIRHLKWLGVVYKMFKQNSDNNVVFFLVYFKLCSVFTLLFPNVKQVLDIRTGSISANHLENLFVNKLYRFESLFFKHITILSLGLISLLKIETSKCHYLPLGSEILSGTDKLFDQINLLYVGTFNGRNIHETIDGLKMFLDKYSDSTLSVSYDIFGFGTKENERKIKAAITDNGLDSIVHFHGRKNHVELQPYFDKCNIGIAFFPITKYYEYQPATKIFEYILSGMVCIATDTYENRALINQRNGVICKDNRKGFADALNHVLSNQLNYDSKEIRSTLKSFTWEKIVRNNLKPYIDNLYY